MRALQRTHTLRPLHAQLLPATYRLSIRGCKSMHDDRQEREPGTVWQEAARELNVVLAAYPIPSFISYLGLNYSIFGVCFVALKIVSFDAPMLAAAVLIARSVKRLRLPVDVAIAAALTRSWPLLAEVKLGALVAPPMEQGDGKDDGAFEQNFKKAQNFLVGPINKYGAALLLSHSMMGVATVLSLHTVLSGGTDISAWTAWLGVSNSLGDSLTSTASAVGGAACVNSLALPLTVLMLPSLVPAVADIMVTTPLHVLKDTAEATDTTTAAPTHTAGIADEKNLPQTPLEMVRERMSDDLQQQERYKS